MEITHSSCPVQDQETLVPNQEVSIPILAYVPSERYHPTSIPPHKCSTHFFIHSEQGLSCCFKGGFFRSFEFQEYLQLSLQSTKLHLKALLFSERPKESLSTVDAHVQRPMTSTTQFFGRGVRGTEGESCSDVLCFRTGCLRPGSKSCALFASTQVQMLQELKLQDRERKANLAPVSIISAHQEEV